MLSSWSASSLSPSTRTQSASQHSRTAQPLIDRLMHLESMGQDELRKTAHARNQLAQDLQKARASALGREKINTERIRNLQESFKRAEGTIAGLRADLQGKDAEMEALRQQLAEANTALSACDGARKLALDEARVWKARAHAAIRDAAEAREATGREQRARDEALATEKAARVSQVSKQILRRALCRELTLGWTAWVERTRAKLYALGRLREVANRLHSETREVAGAFYWWAEDARASKAEMRETAMEARVQSKEAELLSAQSAWRTKQMQQALAHAQELEDARATVRAECAAELSRLSREHDETVANLRALIAEHEAAAKAQAMSNDEALATERAARVSQVSKQILRRALCRELTLGWTAWVERTRAKLYALGRLREVANRLHSETREVAGAFYWWAEDARASKAEMRETSITALFQKLQDSEAQVRRLQRAVRDQEPATAKYTKGKRLQRAAEGREARKRLQDAFELAAPPSKSK